MKRVVIFSYSLLILAVNVANAQFTGCLPGFCQGALCPAPTSPTTWNSSDLSNVTLSGSDLISTVGVGNGGVRGVLGRTCGKYYMEYTYNTINTNSIDTGIALSSASLVGGSNAGIAFVNRVLGQIVIDGTNLGTPLGLINTADVIGVATDLTSRLIWFRIAPSGNWNGDVSADPATGTGGLSITSMSTGSLFPWMTGNSGDKITANFGASSFTGTVPSGFNSGWK